MSLKTSVYLTDELTAAVRESGVPIAELVRRGMGAADPDEALAERAAMRAAEIIRADLDRIAHGTAMAAAKEVSAAVLEDIQDTVRSAVRSALADAQGGF